MSNFPTLKTGAVLQYPAQKEVRFTTEIVRFMDGSEQRFREYQTSLHRWMIRLELLDQGELQVLREFFRTQAGGAAWLRVHRSLEWRSLCQLHTRRRRYGTAASG